MNAENRAKFSSSVKDILQDPKTEVLPGKSLRGTEGTVYITKDITKYNLQNVGPEGLAIGVHDEGRFINHIKKVQPLSPKQDFELRNNDRLD
jgi:hypothetical protein